MRGNLADLAATGIASEPTLRKWIAAEPDQQWIIKRGSNGDAYEIDIPGAVEAFRAKEERAVQAARERADSINQLALELGIRSLDKDQPAAELSILERRQLLEEEIIADKLARQRGELISFVDAAAAFRDVLVRFRQQGETFAARLSKKVDLSREQIAAIDAMASADLGRLADWMEGLETQLGNGGINDPAPAAAAVEDPAATDRRPARARPGKPPPSADKAGGKRVGKKAPRIRS